MLHNVCTDTSQMDQMIFDSLQQCKPEIAHLDVLSMIHDLLHFFHERIQPNFTLVVAKFYSGLRNVHYHVRLNLVSACETQLRFLHLCCLLWFDSSVHREPERCIEQESLREFYRGHFCQSPAPPTSIDCKPSSPNLDCIKFSEEIGEINRIVEL